MQVYIQWHEEKRCTNLREHGIDFIDLVDFFDGELITDEDVRYEYAEARFQSIGDAQRLRVLCRVDTDRDRCHEDSSDLRSKGDTT